jgi:uncharacterized protein YecE (DUF72 family)
VEIDSSFYRIPNELMVKNWAKRTLDNFRFTAKFAKVITHDKQLVDVEDDVDLFLTNMEPLQEKDACSTCSVTPFNGDIAWTRRSKKSPTIFG